MKPTPLAGLLPLLIASGIGLASVDTCFAQSSAAQAVRSEVKGQLTLSEKYDQLIPRRLLGLIHSTEVQEEIGLTESELPTLEAFFGEIDGEWFLSRNLKSEDQVQVLAKLEGKLWEWAATHMTPEQISRLKQIEIRAQAARALLRDDLADQIPLDAKQQAAIARLAIATQKLEAELNQAYQTTGITPAQQKAFASARQAEWDSLKDLLQPNQIRGLQSVLGKPFDLTKLKSLRLLAPELIASEHWINSSPIQLKDLRGKVVLLHFYAFQCHNCHANFDTYRKWHSELKEKGVVVIGVQTPELQRERDPKAVQAAAEENQLEFPILVDIQKENWDNWGTTLWPTVYVIDQNGYVRHIQPGELKWKGARYDQLVEKVVDELLAEKSL